MITKKKLSNKLNKSRSNYEDDYEEKHIRKGKNPYTSNN